jgi:hypothetical protein
LGEVSGGIVAFDEDGEDERKLLADAGLVGLTSTLESKSGRASGEGRHVFFKASGDGLRNRTVKGGALEAMAISSLPHRACISQASGTPGHIAGSMARPSCQSCRELSSIISISLKVPGGYARRSRYRTG